MRGHLFITVLMFLLFYTPPILGLNCLWILTIMSLLYIVFNIRFIRANINCGRLQTSYIVWAVIIVYLLFVALFNDNNIDYIKGKIYWLITIIPTCTTISCAIKKNKLDSKSLIELALFAGLIQSVLAILAFLFPSLKSTFLSALTNANLIRDEAYYAGAYIYRLFGYSGGLTFGMPVLQAFLAMISLFFGIRYSMKYFAFFPFLAFSAVINARSSFVVFALCGMCLFLVLMDKRIKIFNFVAICLFVFLVLFLGYVILPVFEFVSQDTLSWIGRGITEIHDLLLKGDTTEGYFSYLFDERRWVFPEGLSFVFGEGIRVMGTGLYPTDIGYVNDVWHGGILYTIVIYFLCIKYTKTFKFFGMNDLDSRFGRYLEVSVFILSIFLNFKGFFIDINNLTSFLILILVYTNFLKNISVKQ